ncbi:MAG: glycosyltransferase family 4 protein [Caldilineaceae bacterium]|nr:glycosyltransferase family 4 protein [Caldilineaceae bacterium]
MSQRAPLRVLILVASFAIEGPLGGVARFVVELSRALDRQRIRPIVGALWDYHTEFDRRWLARLHDEGIDAFIAADWAEASPYGSCVAALRGLWRHAPGPVAIIHSHGEFTDLAALALRRHLSARAVVRTVHNEVEWAKRPLFGKLFPNLLYPFAFDAELAVARQALTNLDARPLARLLGRRSSRMANALNFARFEGGLVDRTTKRASLGLPAEAVVIGSVGRLAPQKGYHVLLNAAPLVLRAIPNAHFLVIGDGRLAEPLRAQAQALGIAERVLFTGSRQDVEELYAVMDCFVSSSLWEGLPTVVLESIAARVPVVATRVAGNTELVVDGESGVLTPPGDAQALAQGIVRLLGDRDWAQQLAGRAYAAARANFSIQAVAEQQSAFYERLLG